MPGSDPLLELISSVVSEHADELQPLAAQTLIDMFRHELAGAVPSVAVRKTVEARLRSNEFAIFHRPRGPAATVSTGDQGDAYR